MPMQPRPATLNQLDGRAAAHPTFDAPCAHRHGAVPGSNQSTRMNKPPRTLTALEKIGYSLGDLAANLIFQTLVTFLAFFYTDVFQIPASTAASIIFVVGMFGAFVFTPIVGLLADRTHTRWGKFRPWVLCTAIPFGALSLLAFSTPGLGTQGRVTYAWATYALLVFVYVANNLPYAALSGVLTGNMAQRNSLSSYRFVAVMVAQFIIQVLLLPLVLILGHGDKARGFHQVMMLFAIAGTVFFLITFFTTRERIVPDSRHASSVRADLADLSRNRPWQVMLAVTVLVFVNLALKGGMYIYYFKDYLSAAQLSSFLDHIGFNGFIAALNGLLAKLGLTAFQWPKDAPTSAFSLFNALGILCMIVGIGFSKRLADRFGKRNVHGFSARLPRLSAGCHRAGDGVLCLSRLFLRHHHPAAMGDDCGRGRLLRMEKPAPRHRHHLLRHAVRLESGAQRRWRAGRGHPGFLRLPRRCADAIGRCRRRHSPGRKPAVLDTFPGRGGLDVPV
jgi:Na+/melibiose symporter-like transporter